MAELFLGGKIDPATHERTGDEVRLDTDMFTTHGVIVGMTGSGKTGLGVVLIEEVLSAGLPALLIDPKGDLTNLCLTFPELRPSDFRPWVDEAQAKASGQSVDEFAASQAELWTKGLLGWGITSQHIAQLRSTTDFTIYTPGSQSGVPLNIVGSLQAPADLNDDEIVSDEIEGYVSGLLALVGIDADPLSSREHILLSNLIHHSWSDGRSLDLPTLVGLVGNPPIRKLGVFELDEFFPAKDRLALAMQLNGLLASRSFAAWAQGPPIDIASMLYTPDGRGRCAIVTTAHLSDEERQFVTSLVLGKLVTWMRRQSGTTDLRALVYMDEVAGYLPPTANPPTKKPILTLMKQARAFGVGTVLSTQNPVDVDYKALSNAGTWMIGRLSTERDKARLIEGLKSAAGEVDIAAVSDTISGLGKRQFVVRTPGSSQVSVVTSRWAMSYLRGPMTRDQIATLMASARPGTGAEPASNDGATGGPSGANPVDREPDGATGSDEPDAPGLGDDESLIMPTVADGVPVRWVDVASPWLREAGGDARGERLQAAIAARVDVRYSDARADLSHDTEYECIITPLGDSVDVGRSIEVDYDDRDLRPDPPERAVYLLVDAKISTKAYFRTVETAVRDHVTRNVTLAVPANKELKLTGRPGESSEGFDARCRAAASERADAEIAKLRTSYESRARRLRDQIATAEGQVNVLSEQAKSRRNSEMLSTAGSVLGGLLSGKSRTRMLDTLGGAAGRRGQTRAADERLNAAEGKLDRLGQQLEDLEHELAEAIIEIDRRWSVAATQTETVEIAPKRTNVTISDLCVAWLPVSR